MPSLLAGAGHRQHPLPDRVDGKQQQVQRRVGDELGGQLEQGGGAAGVCQPARSEPRHLQLDQQLAQRRVERRHDQGEGLDVPAEENVPEGQDVVHRRGQHDHTQGSRQQQHERHWKSARVFLQRVRAVHVKGFEPERRN